MNDDKPQVEKQGAYSFPKNILYSEIMKRGYSEISEHWVLFLDEYLSQPESFTVKLKQPIKEKKYLICRNYFIAIALDTETYAEEDLAMLFGVELDTIRYIFDQYRASIQLDKMEMVENPCIDPYHIQQELKRHPLI